MTLAASLIFGSLGFLIGRFCIPTQRDSQCTPYRIDQICMEDGDE